MSLKIGFCFIVLTSCVVCYDEGFDLFFKTNLEEMTDVEIQFESELPTWIKGTLVCLVTLNKD